MNFRQPFSAIVLEDVAPAKVNLSLRVVGRRADGFHLLDMVNAPLQLCDRIRLAIRPAQIPLVSLSLSDGGIRLDGPAQQPSGNLATRAAEEFLRSAQISAAVQVTLEKRIPFGAGLGGGSSDAACVLRLMQRAFPQAIDKRQLLDIAIQLGSDVPYFLEPRLSRIRGVGERCDPLPLSAGALASMAASHSGTSSGPARVALPLLLAAPPWPLATPRVYAKFRELHPDQAALTCRSKAAEAFTKRVSMSADPIQVLMREGTNDLEAPAEQLLPELRELRMVLMGLLNLPIRLSGSGSALFCLLPAPLTSEELSRLQQECRVSHLSLLQTHLIF